MFFKSIFGGLFALTLLLTAVRVSAGAMYANTSGAERFPTLVGTYHKPHAGSNVHAQIDFKYPDSLTAPFTYHISFAIALGMNATTFTAQQGNPIGPDNLMFYMTPKGNAINSAYFFEISRTIGGVKNSIRTGEFFSPRFDHVWHRCELITSGTQLSLKMDGVNVFTPMTVAGSFPSGSRFMLISSSYSPPNPNFNLLFDNLMVNQVPLDTFNQTSGTILAPANAPWVNSNSGNFYTVTSAENSPFAVPVELSSFQIE